MMPHFWPGKRVFLTGHTGFKGSWLSLWLQKLGAQLTGYSLAPPTTPNMFHVTHVAKGMHSILGDIRNLEGLKQSMENAQPEIVIHMAAQSLVRVSYQDPVETYATNVMGTVNLLEAVRHTPPVKAVVIVTSDKCYENKEWIWGYRESEPLGGYDPYSSSKAGAELVTGAYRSSFFNEKNYEKHGVSIATVRSGNVIGGGDWSEDRLIPDLIKALEHQNKIHIRNPNATRPWQYVPEPLYGYLQLAEKLYTEGPFYGEAWNFGPTDEGIKTVRWIAEKMSELWGEKLNLICDSQKNPHEAKTLKLDSSKANIKLGWKQGVNLPETLQHIIDWHRLYGNKADMHDETLKKIHAYEEKLKIQ